MPLQVSLQDVSASYTNPSLLDPCEEFTFRQRIGLQGAQGSEGVTAVNGTAIRIDGPATVSVLVQDGQQRMTGESTLPKQAASGSSTDIMAVTGSPCPA
jgi:hypothetical protein